ncbi:MAG: hypothetical protein Q7R35_02580 [Elusimicrobiota bacterium]|nr:hypothetical protein [Elusimicrobiota bacterium]
MPAYEYYCGTSPDTQNRLDEMIQYFCDRPFGTILPKTMYRIEDPTAKIYAFKPIDERFFNFTASGGVVVVTNAYHKQSRKMRKIDLEQLKIAVRYKMDYLERIKRNTYYAY